MRVGCYVVCAHRCWLPGVSIGAPSSRSMTRCVGPSALCTSSHPWPMPVLAYGPGTSPLCASREEGTHQKQRKSCKESGSEEDGRCALQLGFGAWPASVAYSIVWRALCALILREIPGVNSIAAWCETLPWLPLCRVFLGFEYRRLPLCEADSTGVSTYGFVSAAGWAVTQPCAGGVSLALWH